MESDYIKCPQCNGYLMKTRLGQLFCPHDDCKTDLIKWEQHKKFMNKRKPKTPPAPKPPPKPTKTQTSVLPTDPAERKIYPIYSGCINYFPDALALVAKRSYEGNQQHHPNKPLHWDRSKSSDELDAMIRHIIEGEWDAVAWRALAHLQREIDKGWRPKND